MRVRHVRRAVVTLTLGVAVPLAVATTHGRDATAAGTFGSPVTVGSGASEPGIHVEMSGKALDVLPMGGL